MLSNIGAVWSCSIMVKSASSMCEVRKKKKKSHCCKLMDLFHKISSGQVLNDDAPWYSVNKQKETIKKFRFLIEFFLTRPSAKINMD